jgi:ribosomal protein S18 acetylase RimI-like enzyme
MMIKIIRADNRELISKARELFHEYALSLGFDLSFQNFEHEMSTFPAQYSPPQGCLLLAQFKDAIVGCVGLRDLGESRCEMKRMYVQPNYRGKGLGRVLAKAIISEARGIGYKHMRLDTIPSMKAAFSLYLSLGFREIEPYRFNPIEGAKYLELELG